MAQSAEQRLDEVQVRSAVDALFKHLAKEQASKSSLLEEEDIFSLVVALKKIPGHGSAKPHRITLPHPLWQVDGSEVCLFVKDHAGEGQKAAKERLAQADSCGVTKVIGLSKLKANYKPFEAKRRLCASFDLFLADDRILPLLPPLLGKQFFKKKKQPIPAAQQVVANILASAAGVAHYVPRGWSNIRAMYLKTNASVALPIFTCLPSLEMEGEQPGAERKKSRKSKKAKTEGGADTAAEPKDAPVAGAKRKADEAAPAKQKTTPGTTLGAQAARAATQEPAGKRAKR